MALAGVSVAIGILVVLRYAQIPFFMYYPRTTNTVLVSESVDMLLFVGASLCVPLSLLLFALQPGTRRRAVRNAGVILVVVLAVWLSSFVFMSRSPSLTVETLFASTVSVAIVDVSASDSVYGLEWRRAVSEMLVPLMTIFALIEFSPIYYWILSAINPGTLTGREAAELELNLTYSPFLLEPLILVALLSSWIWIPVILRILKLESSPRSTDESPRIRGPAVSSRTLAASIDLIAIVAILVFYYPYTAGQHWIVGVDSYMRYYDPLVQVSGMHLSAAIWTVASTFHGVYVGLLLIVRLATGLSPFSIVKYAPLVLAIITSVTVFWIFLQSGRRIDLAVLAAACNLLWLPTTVGIWSAPQANWTAYALWMLFAASMLRWTMRASRGAVYFVLQAIASLGILLIHPWTWGVFVATLIILTVTLRLEKIAAATHVPTASVLSSLALAVPVGAAGILVAPGIRSDMFSTMTMYMHTFSNPNGLTLISGALSSVFEDWGSFLNPFLMIISLLGVFVVIRRKDSLSMYVVAWIVVWSIGSVLAAPEPIEMEALWRMLYVSPLPLLLAYGISGIVQLSRRLEMFNSSSEHFATQTFFATVGVVAPLSAFIVAFPSPMLKLVAVLAALALTFVLVRFVPANQVASILVLAVLVLIVVNGAFRSLYPLLLDPHNLRGI
jgi:hypothetical protein